MKIETVIALVMAEIDRAETLHPVWPRNLIHAGSIVIEEAGELVKEVNNHNEKKGAAQSIVTEAVHTAAMAIRFLKNIEKGETNE